MAPAGTSGRDGSSAAGVALWDAEIGQSLTLQTGIQLAVTNMPQNVQRAYDKVAEDYAKFFPDTRTEAPLDIAMIGEFLRHVRADSPARVLDAGCGAGRMTRYLAETGCAVEGVDLSPGMIAMAKRDHPNLRFSVGSLMSLPHQAAEFSGVLLWYSIIHSPPTEHSIIFNEIARVLRPAGRVIVGFQAGEGVQDLSPVYRKFGHEIQLLRYLNTATSVAERMEAAGFRITCRLERRAQGPERDDHAILIAELTSSSPVP